MRIDKLVKYSRIVFILGLIPVIASFSGSLKFYNGYEF